MAFAIKVNGNTHSLDVDGDTPLLWVLRDVLGMTGTKFGCGMALCGACTVHIDGVATRSCITPIDASGGSEITTIEAIGATPAGAKIQKLASIGRSFNAATASRAKSCRLRRCSRVTRIRRMPRSTTQCPATFAAVGPMSAFAKRSSWPHNQTDREAGMILNQNHVPAAATRTNLDWLTASLVGGFYRWERRLAVVCCWV